MKNARLKFSQLKRPYHVIISIITLGAFLFTNVSWADNLRPLAMAEKKPLSSLDAASIKDLNIMPEKVDAAISSKLLKVFFAALNEAGTEITRFKSSADAEPDSTVIFFAGRLRITCFKLKSEEQMPWPTWIFCIGDGDKIIGHGVADYRVISESVRLRFQVHGDYRGGGYGREVLVTIMAICARGGIFGNVSEFEPVIDKDDEFSRFLRSMGFSGKTLIFKIGLSTVERAAIARRLTEEAI